MSRLKERRGQTHDTEAIHVQVMWNPVTAEASRDKACRAMLKPPSSGLFVVRAAESRRESWVGSPRLCLGSSQVSHWRSLLSAWLPGPCAGSCDPYGTGTMVSLPASTEVGHRYLLIVGWIEPVPEGGR